MLTGANVEPYGVRPEASGIAFEAVSLGLATIRRMAVSEGDA